MVLLTAIDIKKDGRKKKIGTGNIRVVENLRPGKGKIFSIDKKTFDKYKKYIGDEKRELKKVVRRTKGKKKINLII